VRDASAAGVSTVAEREEMQVRRFSGIIALTALLAAVIIEFCLVMVLHDKIDRQSEAVVNISHRLQELKNERAGLHATLSGMKKISREEKDGHTP
jgi:hypothetical protein